MRTAEKVRKGDLHGNAAFYLDNPIEIDCLPHYVGASPEIALDDEVWILYFSEAHRQGYFKRELQGRNYDRLVGQKTGLAAVGEAVRMPYYDGFGGFTA
jgi:hypothetical protein